MEKIVLIPEDGASPEEFYVLDIATLAGQNYLIVTDEEEGDGTALILRELSAEDGAEVIYEIRGHAVELVEEHYYVWDEAAGNYIEKQ